MADLQLIVVDGPNTGTEFDIAGSSVIGRDPSSGIVLDDTPYLARDPNHAFSVEDLRAWEKKHGRVPAFRAAVRRAVHSCDTPAAEERHAEACKDRRVAARANRGGHHEVFPYACVHHPTYAQV